MMIMKYFKETTDIPNPEDTAYGCETKKFLNSCLQRSTRQSLDCKHHEDTKSLNTQSSYKTPVLGCDPLCHQHRENTVRLITCGQNKLFHEINLRRFVFWSICEILKHPMVC